MAPNPPVVTGQMKETFIYDMAMAGQYSANLFNYPLPAMIACACIESGFGTSPIYKITGNPFNLQKPSREFSLKHHMPIYDWPKCATLTSNTKSTHSGAAGPAPFCIAINLLDAARQFCEWIDHYPNVGARVALQTRRHDPVQFANGLFLVGFANNSAAHTQAYGKLVVDFKLREHYSEGPPSPATP